MRFAELPGMLKIFLSDDDETVVKKIHESLYKNGISFYKCDKFNYSRELFENVIKSCRPHLNTFIKLLDFNEFNFDLFKYMDEFEKCKMKMFDNGISHIANTETKKIFSNIIQDHKCSCLYIYENMLTQLEKINAPNFQLRLINANDNKFLVELTNVNLKGIATGNLLKFLNDIESFVIVSDEQEKNSINDALIDTLIPTTTVAIVEPTFSLRNRFYECIDNISAFDKNDNKYASIIEEHPTSDQITDDTADDTADNNQKNIIFVENAMTHNKTIETDQLIIDYINNKSYLKEFHVISEYCVPNYDVVKDLLLIKLNKLKGTELTVEKIDNIIMRLNEFLDENDTNSYTDQLFGLRHGIPNVIINGKRNEKMLGLVRKFVNDCCTKSIGAKVYSSDLYNSFFEYLSKNSPLDIMFFNRNNFTPYMKQLNYKSKRDKSGIFWIDIGFKTASPSCDYPFGDYNAFAFA